ncbi:hypothetical protein SCLCIDRAFT_1006972 [Scleroderma citrinum Foug A]|uniref:Uncharacterized protein n=1 Tax=Scleroderma citrinum Foug A TaxID=1036808 RepID=A0A0C3EJS5_9AGAM|nr:hypothetical protein SCLCIDRAFT_1006972 [Scleroderma citrinum Foug A]
MCFGETSIFLYRITRYVSRASSLSFVFTGLDVLTLGLICLYCWSLWLVMLGRILLALALEKCSQGQLSENAVSAREGPFVRSYYISHHDGIHIT